MNIAICDDMKEYILPVKAYAEEYFKTKHIDCDIDTFCSGTDLLSSDTAVHILFLDIELGDSNGIDIAKQIQAKFPNTVILMITSFRQYLDDAMDINVTRYIDKPITQERVFSALDKAMSVLSESFITFHLKSNQIIRLKTADIIYAEAKLKKVTIYAKTDIYTVLESLKEIKQMLTASCFAVPHNSYIVNLNYIKEFKRDEILLAAPYEHHRIAIATRKQHEFKNQFFEYIGEDCNYD